MDDEETRRLAARRDAFLRELERRSLDTIMVYNPTDKDYLLEWDKRYHRIPARTKNMGFGNGKMELSRYLAEKYAREMKNQLINLEADQFMRVFRQERADKGQQFRDKFEENNEALPIVPKTSDSEKIKEIYAKIILGVVREYGMDAPEMEEGEKIDDKTPEEKVLDQMNKPYEPEPVSTPAEEVPASKKPAKVTQKRMADAVMEVSK